MQNIVIVEQNVAPPTNAPYSYAEVPGKVYYPENYVRERAGEQENHQIEQTREQGSAVIAAAVSTYGAEGTFDTATPQVLTRIIEAPR